MYHSRDADGDKGIDIDEFHRALGISLPPPAEPVTAMGSGGGAGASLVASASTVVTPLLDDVDARGGEASGMLNFLRAGRFGSVAEAAAGDGDDDEVEERHEGRACAGCELSGQCHVM